MDPSYLTVLSCIHNTAVVSFHRTDPLILASQSSLVQYIIERCPQQFSKYAEGQYPLNICQAATDLKTEIADIQSILMKLKVGNLLLLLTFE